jgi:hypothetical protein
MVAICIINKKGKLKKIKEISDIYRYVEYNDEEEK